MKPDCRNDCAPDFEFPRRIENRAGLPHIRYRIGDYADFREAILRDLNKNGVLGDWTHRESDDPGIALLEGSAVLGDILTFYQELYANEAYLRTAQWRESVADLVRLLGYRLSPGVGGQGTFAFEVDGDKPVTIPAGFALKAQVTGLAQQAEFETQQTETAVPALSRFHLYRPSKIPKLEKEVSNFSINTHALELAGVTLEEKDRLLLIDDIEEDTANATIVVVKKVETSFDRTKITIAGEWRQTIRRKKIIAYKLGRTFRHFGHNAPPQVIKIVDGKPQPVDIRYKRMLFTPKYIRGTKANKPSSSTIAIPLDNEVDDLQTNTTLIIQGIGNDKETVTRRLVSFRVTSMTWGAVSGGSTMIIVDNSLGQSLTDIRDLSIHETVGQKFELTAVRDVDADTDGSALYFYGTAAAYQQLHKRRLAFTKGDETTLEMVVTINKTKAALAFPARQRFRKLNLGKPLNDKFSLDDFPLTDDPIVTVFGNLAVADQGKTEREAVLGNGDGRLTFQTFKLPKSPLTYHNNVDETPPEQPELQIYVDNCLWKRVASFFGHQANEEIYIVREDIQGDSWVQFGDGKTGKRLPSGLKNVVAKYRTGTGAYGPLKPETTVQAGVRLTRLDKIQLPGIVSGGDLPESGDNAREAAPGKIQSLDRLVSLQDYESETLAIPGVSKVTAVWQLVNNIPTIVLTVLMETGREAELTKVREILAGYNRCRGPRRFIPQVIAGQRKAVSVSISVAYDPILRQELVKKAVKEALGLVGEEMDGVDGSDGLFSLRHRRFGQSEYITRIEGVIQNVEGVLWNKVSSPKSLASAKNSPPEFPCLKTHILTLPKGDLTLNSVSVPAAEDC